MSLLDFIQDEQSRKDMARNLRNLGQSASNTVAENASVPVDLLAMGLRRLGVPVPSNALGGSEWMKQAGLMADVPNGAPKIAGEALGLLAPVVGMAKAPEIADALRKLGYK